MRDVRERVGHVREVHRQHELVLEGRVGRQLIATYPARHIARLEAFFHIQQCNPSSIARSVAHRVHILQRQVGDQPDDHRFGLIDVAAEPACQDQLVGPLQPGLPQRGQVLITEKLLGLMETRGEEFLVPESLEQITAQAGVAMTNDSELGDEETRADGAWFEVFRWGLV